jgi:hypothetical protein
MAELPSLVERHFDRRGSSEAGKRRCIYHVRSIVHQSGTENGPKIYRNVCGIDSAPLSPLPQKVLDSRFSTETPKPLSTILYVTYSYSLLPTSTNPLLLSSPHGQTTYKEAHSPQGQWRIQWSWEAWPYQHVAQEHGHSNGSWRGRAYYFSACQRRARHDGARHSEQAKGLLIHSNEL